MNDQYYLDMQGHTAGPFTAAEVGHLLVTGSVTEATLFARPGGVEWMPLGSIAGIIHAASAPPSQVMPRPAAQVSSPHRQVVSYGDWICNQCGHAGIPRIVTPGSGWITLLLLLIACIPGIIYEIWRSTARRRVCAACGGQSVIPATSPAAAGRVELKATLGPYTTRLGRAAGQSYALVMRRLSPTGRIVLWIVVGIAVVGAVAMLVFSVVR